MNPVPLGDRCDREIMSYVATTAAITGEMIRDLTAESVERRVGADALCTPHPVEWLSETGHPMPRSTAAIPAHSIL